MYFGYTPTNLPSHVLQAMSSTRVSHIVVCFESPRHASNLWSTCWGVSIEKTSLSSPPTRNVPPIPNGHASVVTVTSSAGKKAFSSLLSGAASPERRAPIHLSAGSILLTCTNLPEFPFVWAPSSVVARQKGRTAHSEDRKGLQVWDEARRIEVLGCLPQVS